MYDMSLDRIFLLATAFNMLLNVIGWEGIRRHFLLTHKAAIPEAPGAFLQVVVPWAVRLEFLYYLALVVFVLRRPRLFPLAAVLFLVLYHSAGFILSERQHAVLQRQDSSNLPATGTRAKRIVLGVISLLDAVEMVLLIYFCRILTR